MLITDFFILHRAPRCCLEASGWDQGSAIKVQGPGGRWHAGFSKCLPQHSLGLDDLAAWLPWGQCGCCWTCPRKEGQAFNGHTCHISVSLAYLADQMWIKRVGFKEGNEYRISCNGRRWSMYLQVETPPPLETYFSFPSSPTLNFNPELASMRSFLSHSWVC